MDAGTNKPDLSKAYLNIVLWNLTPYWGVLFLHWAPLTVFICYALETIVIGVFNVFKLIAVYYYGQDEPEGEGPGDMGLFAIPAFASAYGLLAYLQLVMFFVLCGIVRNDNTENSLAYSLSLVFDNKTLYLILSLFVVSNAYSFINYFILPQYYARVTMNQQMAEPFPRVIISQFVVFGGTAIYMSFGSPWIILVIMTALKIAMEIFLLKHKPADIFGWD